MTRWTAGDHPRSRGVYLGLMLWARVKGGSSPLARGLLAQVGGAPTRRGIIPARAGFTCGAPRQSHVSPDHPRSRGVYIHEDADQSAALGSSPLARGLRFTFCVD